jgi:hypothetical protein
VLFLFPLRFSGLLRIHNHSFLGGVDQLTTLARSVDNNERIVVARPGDGAYGVWMCDVVARVSIYHQWWWRRLKLGGSVIGSGEGSIIGGLREVWR